MTVTEMDVWVSSLREKLVSGEARLFARGRVDPRPDTTDIKYLMTLDAESATAAVPDVDVSGQVAALLQRYEEARATCATMSDDQRVAVRVAGISEAVAVLAKASTGGTHPVHQFRDGVVDTLSALIDSYNIPTLRRDADMYRSRADALLASGDATGASVSQERVTAIENRVHAALKAMRFRT